MPRMKTNLVLMLALGLGLLLGGCAAGQVMGTTATVAGGAVKVGTKVVTTTADVAGGATKAVVHKVVGEPKPDRLDPHEPKDQ